MTAASNKLPAQLRADILRLIVKSGHVRKKIHQAKNTLKKFLVVQFENCAMKDVLSIHSRITAIGSFRGNLF
jgi:hypothetical protein